MPDLRPNFWADLPLEELTQPEWEALCDGCGKCCANKLEYDDSPEVFLTNVACALFDDASCQCLLYKTRHDHVPECVTMTMESIPENLSWLPQTCAYRLRYEGKPLFSWHPLISGSRESVHGAGISMRGRTVSEGSIPEEDWGDHIIDEPM